MQNFEKEIQGLELLNPPFAEFIKGLMNKKIKSKMKGEVSFKVFDVFGNRIKGYVPQYLGENYRQYVFIPNQNKVLTIPKNLQKLVGYRLIKKMNNFETAKETKSTPMDEESFLIVLYLLIIKPELGKELLNYELKKDGNWYLFHLNLDLNKNDDLYFMSLHIRWYHDEWHFRLYNGKRDNWRAGTVFIHFATV